MAEHSQRPARARSSGSQRERAYESLRQRLITLDLQPGDALDVQGLMSDLAVGRTPLIEAMQQLAREDLLAIHPRQGTVVTQPSFSQARHIVELRDGYEGRVARLAARRRTTEDLREIREIDARLQAASDQDTRQLLLDDLALHLSIARAAGNPLLLQALDHLLALYTRLWFLFAKTGGTPKPRHFSHSRLIDAIAAGNPEAAEAAALEHVHTTNDVLLSFFTGSDPSQSLPDAPPAVPPHSSSDLRKSPPHQSVTRREFMRAATFAAGLTGLAHPSSVGAESVRPRRGGRIETALIGEPDTLDPHRTRSAVSSSVFAGIFEPLVAKTDELHYEGILAESWEISEGGTEYTFRLRQGIAFHDGTPFDAESVLFTFDRLMAISSMSFLLEPIVRVEAIDRHTVRLLLSEPISPLFDTLSAPFLGMLPPNAAIAPGDQFGRKPIGTGPWMLTEWVTGDRIVLSANPRYQNFHSSAANRGAPELDALIFRFIPVSQQVAAFESGELNVIAVPPEEFARFRTNPDVRLHQTDGGTVLCYLDFATLAPEAGSGARFRPPFDDWRVRQAIGLGINVDQMVEQIMPGEGVRTHGPLPTATFAYKPEIAQHGFRFDPTEAAALLTAAGWIDTDGDGVRERDGVLLDVLLWTFEDWDMVELAAAIQRDLAQLGVRVRIETYDAGTYFSHAQRGVADLHLDSYGWPDPDLLYLMTNGEFGIGQYRDETFQKLVIEARRTTDLATRTELYFEASKKLLSDAAMVPIATYIGTVATHKSVRNFKLGPQGIFVLEDAYVSE